MKKRDYGDFIQDIIDSVNDIGNFIEGMDFEEFIKDKKTIYSVIRAIEIIGEAVKKLPDDFRKNHGAVDWRAMAGTRDKLIHDYFGIDYDIVWDIITVEFPELRKQIKKILK